jgi:hypothetical protein
VKAVTNGPAPFLVNVIKKEPSRIPPLNEITDKVRLALVRMTAESKARDAATAVLKQIKTPNDFEAIASTHHLQIRQTGDFPRATREVPGIGSIPGVTEAASALPSVPGIVDKVMENEGNSFIFKLEKRTPPSDDEWKAEGPAFTHQLLEQKRAAEWLAFVNEMKRQAYITVNPDVLGTSS